jgi:hypothetical protein
MRGFDQRRDGLFSYVRPESRAGLPALALATTIRHFVIMLALPKLGRRLFRPRRMATEISIFYEDGRELLRAILSNAASCAFQSTMCGSTGMLASWRLVMKLRI